MLLQRRWHRFSIAAALGSYLTPSGSKALPVLLAGESSGSMDTTTHPGICSFVDQQRDVPGCSCRLCPGKFAGAQPGRAVLFAHPGVLCGSWLPNAALYSASSQRLLGGRGTNKRGNNAFQEPRASSESPKVRVTSAAETPCARSTSSWSGEHPTELSCQSLFLKKKTTKKNICDLPPHPPKRAFEFPAA